MIARPGDRFHVVVDGTAFYRHFRDKDELLLAIARVRRACLDHPQAATLVAARTARRPHEFAVVDAWLQALLSAGLDRPHAALYFRVLADTTLSFAASDASFARLDATARQGDLQSWHTEYRAAPATMYPHLSEVADFLPGVSQEQVFETVIAAVIAAVESAADIESAPT